MHDDFGIGVAGQVIVVVGQQVLPQFLIVGQLAVEGKAEPLVLLHVVPLERLGIAAVFGPAGGIPHLADCRPAGILAHQAFELAAMAEPKHLADAAQILVGIEQLVAARIVGGEPGRKLAAILNIEQHPRNEPRNFLGTLVRTERACAPARQVINRGYTAFVKQVTHEDPSAPAGGVRVPPSSPVKFPGSARPKTERKRTAATAESPPFDRPRTYCRGQRAV